MSNYRQQRRFQRRSAPVRLARLLPASALSFVVAASAQVSDSDKENARPGAAQTPAAPSSAPSFSRSPSSTTPTPLVSEVTIEEPGRTPNTPPSFYAGSGSSGTSSLGVPGFAATAPSAQAATDPAYPLQWGPFSAHPHLSYGFVYGDGLLYSPGQSTTTASHSVSPGLTIVSKHLTVDYTPTLTYYSKGPYEDSLNHSATLAAHFGIDDWFFYFSQAYQNSSYPVVETGVQTHTETFGTTFDATWNASEKWFFEFTVSQFLQNNEGFEDSRQWSTMEWANYRLTPHLSAGVGLGGGYNDLETGSNSTYEQVQGRINWHPSKRLSVNLNGGVDIRQFLDSPGSDNLINPIMGASISYQPLEFTTIFFSANRSVDNSFYANQITENSSISGGVGQTLFKHLNAGVTAGFRRTDYRNTFASPSGEFRSLRQDDYAFVSTSLGTTFLKKGTVSVSYVHGLNHSSLNGFTYDSDQFSFQIGYRF